MTIENGNLFRCDVCQQIIKSKKFRFVLVHVVSHKDRCVHESACDCEKELDVCNECIQNMNFQNHTQASSAEHREILLEALNDYRKWWQDEHPDFDSTNDMLISIDRAIEYVRGG